MGLTRREFLVATGGMFLWSMGVQAKGCPPLRIAQICDTQLGFGGYDHDVESFRLAVEQINALGPDFVVICGDLVNDGNSDKAVSDFKAIKAGFKMPCHCAPGNHDIGNVPTAKSLARYRRLIGKDYFTFEHKGFQVVIVNTQLWKEPMDGESDKHEAWVRATLTAAQAKKRPAIVVGHIPLYVNRPDEEDEYFSLPLVKRGQLLKLYKETGVVAVLKGHTHRQVLHHYEGMSLLTSAACSRNFDTSPLGFRQVACASTPSVTCKYLPIEGAGPAVAQD